MSKRWMIVVWILIILLGYNGYNNNISRKNVSVDPGKSASMTFFIEERQPSEVLAFELYDLNDDAIEDAVIVYELPDGRKRFNVVYSTKDSYQLGLERPAPVENQKIQLKNIDDEAPMEFIISGSKNGHYGYSIFRIVDGAIIDIFGEGMEDCC